MNETNNESTLGQLCPLRTRDSPCPLFTQRAPKTLLGTFRYGYKCILCHLASQGGQITSDEITDEIQRKIPSFLKVKFFL